MGTLTAGFMMMRWELLSAFLMFCTSQLNIRCRQSSHNVMAFVCSGIGLTVTCFFVMSLMGISYNAEAVAQFWSVSKDVFFDVMSKTPTDMPLL
ncbi:MAG: YjcB family protein [Ewingella sp.]|uniref:YjcB family protein n=1 Tax=Ewingella TaxID=41201 RepID=UPI00264B705D|nr:YjcB family protein [Ewingella sp.]